jgi:acyl-CoA thioester hydrolase
MHIFERSLTVTKSDLDELNHVNNIRYVQWVQNIAKEHWLNNASAEIIRAYYWVMLSHCIEYKSAAFLGDSILIKTFVKKSEGVKSIRIVEIYNNNKTLLASSETTWCLMSSKTNKPARITEDIIKLFN